jgi:hypothetical protein
VAVPVARAQEASSVGAAVEPEQMKARFQMAAMEGVLEAAVQLGAKRLSQQVQAVSPDMLFIAGAARAKGFRLDGYGVFFDVDVPAMRRSVAWQFRNLDRPDPAAIALMHSIRRNMGSIGDPQARREIDEKLRQFEKSMGPPPMPPDAFANQQGFPGNPGQRAEGAQHVNDQQLVASRTIAPPAPAAAAGTPTVLDDPGMAYTNEVKSALIDAMLDFAAPIALDDSEWLTIAARDNAGSRLADGDPYDVSTILLRIRGADLSQYRKSQISRDEARKRVEVKEY